MAIHPIEYRYGTPEMKSIWSEENKLRKMLEVEAALAKAEADLGMIPKEAAEAIEKNIDKVRLERVKEIEDEIQHDTMAIIKAFTEQCEEHGGWIHFGATSYDITDTAIALHMREVLEIIEKDLLELRATLVDLADKNKHLVCAGRTHGQIGTPTTYGLRFAIWADEVNRHVIRLGELRPRILVGKMSGAVGTQAGFGEQGIEVEQKTMEYLGLGVAQVSNQVVQRDRHAEVIMFLGGVATTLDKICTEIRSLQRSEIYEVEEAFGAKQVGSSTMPHKRNPIKSEQVCGLARIIRAMIEPALLNNTLWDERDLTNSSSERIIFPESTVLTDHILRLTNRILGNLNFYPENIKRNLEIMNGLNMAEAVMINLTRKGVSRQSSHELMRTCAMRAKEEGRTLLDALMEEDEINKHFTGDELEEIMKPENYIGTAVEKVEAVVKKLRA